MLQNVLVSGLLTLSGWCIWARRKSWRCKKDAALTLSVVLVGGGVILTIPQSWGLGWLLYSVVGVAHFRDYLGHLSFMGAVMAVIYAVASRLVPDDRIEQVMKRVERPGAVAAAVMLMMIALSPSVRYRPSGQKRDFFNYAPDPYLVGYWTAYSMVMLYLFWFVIRMLRVLRRDPRSRTTANLFIIASLLGVVGVLCMDLHLLWPDKIITPVAWIALCIPGTLGAAAAILSWSRRRHGDSTHR